MGNWLSKWWWLPIVILAIAYVIQWEEERCQAQADKCRASYTAELGSFEPNHKAAEQEAITAACEPNGYFCRLLGPTNLPTVLLVLIGIIGIPFAVRTLLAIEQQTEATAKNVRLQEIAMRQWVKVDKLEARPSPGYHPQVNETRLFFTFNILNPTKSPLTLEWVIIRVNGACETLSFHHFLPPDDSYPVQTFTVIRGKQAQDYGRHELVLSFVATIGYTDVFEAQRRQPFGVNCLLGPPYICQTSPYEGTLPDDEIKKK